jgi:Fuc2NAc and GlcNAc transferase
MAMVSLLIVIGSAAASCLLTYLIWKLALSRGLLDVPNERSSHQLPTPRGGGLAIVLVTTAAFSWLGAIHRLDGAVLAALTGGLMVAAIGLIDDRRPLPAGLRLAAHFGAAVWALAWLGGLPALRFGDQVISLGAAGFVLGALGIVWAMNLFNFMDGIDGIAASEATFVSWTGALLGSMATVASEVRWAAVLLGAACLGFLRWNWPPARIFMGDVGSGYLGYVIAVLAVAATREDPAALWIWLILGGVFFVDATVTLLRRLLRGDRIYEAHRSHAYQWLARRWESHARVTWAVLTVNVLWLLPCAVFATRRPGIAAATAIFALAPLVLFAVVASGRREPRDGPDASDSRP